MKQSVSLALGLSTGLLALVVHSAVGLGQVKPAASGGTGSAGILLVDTDDSCRLVLDGKDQGVVKPDEAKRITVSLGDHILKCTVEGIPDLVWRKVVELKNSEQVAALISLKALHIQYEEATAKLVNEKSKPIAPTGSLSATPHSPAGTDVRDDIYTAAKSAFDRGNYKSAVELFQKVVDADPKHKTAWMDLGRTHMVLRETDSAIIAFKKQTELNPYDEIAFSALGWAYATQRNYDDAADAFNKAIEINPRSQYARSAQISIIGLQRNRFLQFRSRFFVLVRLPVHTAERSLEVSSQLPPFGNTNRQEMEL